MRTRLFPVFFFQLPLSLRTDPFISQLCSTTMYKKLLLALALVPSAVAFQAAPARHPAKFGVK